MLSFINLSFGQSNSSITKKPKTRNWETPPPPAPSKPKIESLKNIRIPLFPGCEEIVTYQERKKCADAKMKEFIYSNLRWPPAARLSCIEGLIVVQVKIQLDGSLTDFKVVRDFGGNGCGEEAVRVLKMMPKWNNTFSPEDPPRSMIYYIPVKFTLE